MVCCLWYVRSWFNNDWLAQCAVCVMYVVGSITIGLARCAVCVMHVVGSITIGWHGAMSVVCT